MLKNNIELLPATKVVKSLSKKSAFGELGVRESEKEINQIGLWLLTSKNHGEWYQLLMTIYDPIRLAKDLTDAGFIILTLNQGIFVLDRQKEKISLEAKLSGFFEDWKNRHTAFSPV